WTEREFPADEAPGRAVALDDAAAFLDGPEAALPERVLLRLPGAEDPEPARAHALAAGDRGRLRRWLGGPRTADAGLVLLTTGAVAVDADGQVADLASAAVWGLVRSAQAEHPGRFALIDVDA
ncbi:hypothetical protein VM98_34610, partial [Streptomyces rubellomurinus subsp. indigoferus]